MNALEDARAAGVLGSSITLEQVGYSVPGLKSERTLLIVKRGS